MERSIHKCYKKIIFYFTLLSLFYSTFSLSSHIYIYIYLVCLSLFLLALLSLSLKSCRSLPTVMSTQPISSSTKLRPALLFTKLLASTFFFSFFFFSFFFFFCLWPKILVFVWLFMVNFGDWIWFEKLDFFFFLRKLWGVDCSSIGFVF